MEFLTRVLFGILILQIYAHAAPTDVSKLEDIAKVERADDVPAAVDVPAAADIPAVVDVPAAVDVHTDDDSTDTLYTTDASVPGEVENDGDAAETSRQKRQFYNPFGYGFPPISKLIYPGGFNNRNNYDNFGAYGFEDPLVQIHKQVQELAGIVRQPPQPSIPQVPIFFPVLFVPSLDCSCNPATPPPSTPPTMESFPPNVTNRFPEMEDNRQNWGLVTDGEDGNDEGFDFSRPLSFDPIKFNRPTQRPAPPVEHGTVQSGSDNDDSEQPGPPDRSGDESPPATTSPPPPPPPTSSTGQDSSFNSQRPPPRRPTPSGPPTPCDVAVLTCCHQVRVTFDCFAIQGCPSFTPYGNPCEPNAILRIIQKYQSFYENRYG